MSDYSLSDIAAASGEGFGGNGGFFWIFALLLLPMLSGGGLWGNQRNATADDIQRSTDFAAIERQLNEGVAATRQGVYDTTGAIKDASYNQLGEIRDIQQAVNVGFSNMQNCCCETNRNIDSVRFDMSNYAAQINANTVAQSQKVIDLLQQNKIDSLQAQVNQLQMQNAMCGVVKYPNASTYYAGANPFCAGAIGCNC